MRVKLTETVDRWRYSRVRETGSDRWTAEGEERRVSRGHSDTIRRAGPPGLSSEDSSRI